MIKVIVFPLMLFSIMSVAQLSSTDMKDASTTGPFPLYIGLGMASSFRNQDFIDIGKEFHRYNNYEGRTKTRLYGLNAMAGFSYIPENWNLSLVIELRYLWLKRSVDISGNQYSLEKNLLSLGIGARYALFPFVIQVQAGPILRHFRYYSFDVDAKKTLAQFHSKFGGINGLIRLTLLDPAGTEGGPGFYFEAGFFLTDFNKSNQELTEAIQIYDSGFTSVRNSNNRTGYLSLGLILPIAIRIP